jgi:acetylornithine/N-succinyldiaminopimelate aminotransferase
VSAADPFVGVYERDLILVGGRGARLEAADGRSFLDFASGIGVNGLGYGDRKVVAAIRAQAGRLIHASNLFHNPPATELAARLAALAFPSRIFFCNSGAEAVEAAVKFARKIGRPSGRFELVAFERGFHGRTCGALSLTWAEKYREPFAPLLPGVRFCPWNDLRALDAVVGEQTAAVVIEPVQGEGGVRPASEELLRGVAEICRSKGALLIVDEIQCGLGRTGDMFAHSASGVKPDMMTLAKPLGGGLPMGATLLAERHATALAPGDHGSTFGGNPVAAAASLAVLERLTSEGFLEKVRRSSGRLMRGLRGIQRRHKSVVAEVRGRGLMVGVELRSDPGPVLKGLRERGILATKAAGNTLRLLPPLVVKPGEIKELLEALEATLASGADGSDGEKR